MANWVVGRSGHPKGRRCKARRLADLLREIGDEQVLFEDREKEGDFTSQTETNLMSRRERMARVLWTRACDGDLKAAGLVSETMDGKPVQPMAVGAEVHFTADDYSAAAARLQEWREARRLDALLKSDG